jgi:DNA-binding sugar fermentation-stimulating protein
MIKRNKWKNRYPEHSSDFGNIDFILVDSEKKDSFLEVKTGSELVPQWYKDVPAKTK